MPCLQRQFFSHGKRLIGEFHLTTGHLAAQNEQLTGMFQADVGKPDAGDFDCDKCHAGVEA